MTNIKNNHYTPLIPEEAAMALVREWSLRERNGDKNARQWAAQELNAFLVETADGTYTLKSQIKDDSSETMHTTHGALREAREKFAEPSQLRGRKNIAILDICSGLGVNAAAALENLKDPIQGWKMEHLVLDMVEISWETLAATLIIPRISEYHDIIRKAVENYLVEHGLLSFSWEEKEIPLSVDIQVHCKDARKLVAEIPENTEYDAVFLDPFSPARSPELYTNEFLSKLANLLKNDGVIITYTSAAPVRYALLNAGLEIGEGPVLGRSGGTIASPSRDRITKPLKAADERMVALSDAGIPYRDPDLNALTEDILNNRHKERMEVRGESKLASTVKTPVYLVSDMGYERQKRRVLKHLQKFNINSLNDSKARFLVCPQFPQCICHCHQERPATSRGRIKEMEKRMEIISHL